MDKLIESYLIGVNADRSLTDDQKRIIAQHLKHFGQVVDSQNQKSHDELHELANKLEKIGG